MVAGKIRGRGENCEKSKYDWKYNKSCRLLVYSSGLITGFVTAGSETFLIAMLDWAAAVIIGALLLGVSEVIRLLQMLVDKAK